MGVQMEALLTVREAAGLMRISERKLWDLTRHGGLPCVRFGRAVRYDPADLRAWLDGMKRGSDGGSVG